MDYAALRNLAFRAIVEAAADDDKEKKKKEEEEKNQQEDQANEEDPKNNPDDAATEEEETDPDEQTEDETPEDGNPEETETEDPEADEEGGDEPPADGDPPPEGEGDAGADPTGADDFGLDPEGGDGEDDLGPAPDGLPEADDDGSDDEMDDEQNQETNVQVNILKLSELDRVLAKKTCFQYFVDLKAKVQSTLAVIDKNETVIDPDVRENAIDRLSTASGQLDQFMEYKLPIMNYEEAIQAYFVFVNDINTIIEDIKNDGIVGEKSKHKNKESS